MNQVDLEQYFRTLFQDEKPNARASRLAWNLSCLEAGRGHVRFLKERGVALDGVRVLDLAGGFGGHGIAFSEAGARVVCADINEHCYAELATFCADHGLDLTPCMADCQNASFLGGVFDVILALELMEHVDSAEALADEIARLLRPGGCCFVSTPSRWVSFFWGEPHYSLRGLTILPFFAQRFVATRIFRKSYPFPITRQYTFSSGITRLFESRGLSCETLTWGGRIGRLCARFPFLDRFAKAVFWRLVVVTKPAAGRGNRSADSR